MSGLNTEVSKKFPIEDGCMGCRDVSLAFIGSSANDFIDLMKTMICMLYVLSFYAT